MHKEEDLLQAFERWRNEEDEPSQKERLAEFDDDEAAVVRLRLTEDPDFQAKARLIAERPAVERRAAAEREAGSYAPYRGAGRRAIADLLLLMAEEPWRSRGSRASLFFGNLDRTVGVWVDDPSLGDVGARRVRERWDPLVEGAQALADFGAGRCIGCPERFVERYERGYSARRSRRKHCEKCRARDGSLCRSREANMRQAFDVLTGARQRSRANRRASS